MCAVSFERTISKNEDLVCLTDAGDSLGYEEGCRVSFEIVDGFAEFCIRCKVKRTRAVVQNQDFRFFYQRTLAGQLRTLDPDYYAVVDRSNPARVVRALEVCLQTGLPYSRLRTGRRRKRDFDIVKVGIDMPREELYGRIDHRVGQMLADGLEAEARAVYPYRGLNALQTVGYREFFDYFDGRISYDQAVELIKRNSRRYAKRQLTWFRRDAEIRWFGPDQTGAIINYIDFGES